MPLPLPPPGAYMGVPPMQPYPMPPTDPSMVLLQRPLLPYPPLPPQPNYNARAPYQSLQRPPHPPPDRSGSYTPYNHFQNDYSGKHAYPSNQRENSITPQRYPSRPNHYAPSESFTRTPLADDAEPMRSSRSVDRLPLQQNGKLPTTASVHGPTFDKSSRETDFTHFGM